MAGRERLGARAALSRLPRWVTVLGIVLALVVVGGGAALLAMGAPSGLDVVLGRTQTVVLKVDGFHRPNDPETDCRGSGGPLCPNGSPTTAAASLSYRTPAGTRTYHDVVLPFTETVQVPVSGGAVRLDASGGDSITYCSILLKGRDIARKASTPDDTSTTCYAVIPSRAVPIAQVKRH